jgi:hypothetical protein
MEDDRSASVLRDADLSTSVNRGQARRSEPYYLNGMISTARDRMSSWQQRKWAAPYTSRNWFSWLSHELLFGLASHFGLPSILGHGMQHARIDYILLMSAFSFTLLIILVSSTQGERTRARSSSAQRR